MAAPTVMPAAALMGPPAQIATPRPVQKAVTISGNAIGKMRLFCRDVVVPTGGEYNFVVLVYGLDGSSAVIEPPVNHEEHLRVTVAGQTFTCVSIGVSYEYNQCLHVVLPVVADA
jgi:hypothetical protein